MYRSKFEASIAAALTSKGVLFEYEPDKLYYDLPITKSKCLSCGSKEVVQKCYYVPDFKIGPDVYIEAKGRWSSADRKKMQLIREQHPHIKIYMVLQYNNWITKNKIKRYSDICEKLKMDYIIGRSLPENWFS